MPDVVEILSQDHREFARVLSDLRDPARRDTLTSQLAALIAVHSRAEEGEIHPSARAEAGLDAEVRRCLYHQAHVDGLMDRLLDCDPASAAYEDLLDKLTLAVTEQVRLEETVLLPALAAHLDEGRRADLARAFLATRQEYLHLWYAQRRRR